MTKGNMVKNAARLLEEAETAGPGGVGEFKMQLAMLWAQLAQSYTTTR